MTGLEQAGTHGRQHDLEGDRELMNSANPIAPENRRVTIVNLSQ